eukprot:TRINITY_DN103698_c0_g1_i1.p1 TRINITY_DN103698_c0_g1~~TRINITY_DN103698_c0_g1_i1.p1  ORF type:complete len:716 (+),score=101.31 TRINITY_DN103698_c0_g1_i1:98-2245(+)
MGIPGLSAFLRQRYPDAFVNLEKCTWKQVYVYIDLNSILHQCSRHQDLCSSALGSADIEKFTCDVVDSIVWYLSTLRTHGVAVDSMTVCVDGPPSVRKFQEQRDRRRNRVMKKNDEEITGDDLLGLALTPGTDFMDTLSSLCPEKLYDRRAELNCPVFFWDSNTPGEGEHKIATAIAESERLHAGSKHLVIGNDADLILIAMTLSGGITGEISVYSEDVFLASKLAAALHPSGASQQVKASGRTPKGSIAAIIGSRESAKSALDGSACRQATAAGFAFLCLLGGHDYLTAAIKRSKKGSKSYLEWLLPRYTALASPFLSAASVAGPGGNPVWEFRIDKPEALVKMLAEYSDPTPLTEQDTIDCETHLECMLWTISVFANGQIPSYTTVCSAKASIWTLVAYLQRSPARAKALQVRYPLEPEFPLSALAVAACVLPWRDPVMRLLGEAGPPMLQLVQSEFKDLFEFEHAQDAQQQHWASHGVWKGSIEPPTALVLRNLRDFDEKVKQLAGMASSERKVTFSEVICIEPDGEPTVGCLPDEAEDGLEEEHNEVVDAEEQQGELEVSLDTQQQDIGDAVEAGMEGEQNEVAESGEEQEDLDVSLAQNTPQHDIEDTVEAGLEGEQNEAADSGEEQEGSEVSLAQDTPQHAIGDTVECYWPDNGVWLRAAIENVNSDGTVTISWDEDGSQSSVPADYVRPAQEDIGIDPPAKRARLIPA